MSIGVMVRVEEMGLYKSVLRKQKGISDHFAKWIQSLAQRLLRDVMVGKVDREGGSGRHKLGLRKSGYLDLRARGDVLRIVGARRGSGMAWQPALLAVVHTDEHAEAPSPRRRTSATASAHKCACTHVKWSGCYPIENEMSVTLTPVMRGG